MKFSLKTEYALRALIYLASKSQPGPVGAREIAASQNIPERFLEQQITTLKRHGLVASQRGASGGCSLAKNPDEITVLEVVEALEGPVIDMNCLRDGEQQCYQSANCVIQELWYKSQLKLRQFLESVTVADLSKRQLEISSNQNLIYYI
jgi:Rrf2 family protein